jgi:regulatory protein
VDAKKALRLAAARCARRECSSFEVTAWLRRQELEEQEITRCLAFLRENRLVDDERFATAYARDQFRFKRRGRAWIERALRQRQIPGEIISRALAAIVDADDEYHAACLHLLRRKNEGLKEEDPRARKAKLARFALGRGFDLDTIRRALDTLGSSLF